MAVMKVGGELLYDSGSQWAVHTNYSQHFHLYVDVYTMKLEIVFEICKLLFNQINIIIFLLYLFLKKLSDLNGYYYDVCNILFDSKS